MPRNGSGTFNRIYNWTTDAANGIDIEPSRMDGEFDGLATGLSNSIAKDGQTTIAANIPFNSKKITGLANGSARTDSIALGQVQDGTYRTLGTLGGSADTYTATPTPAITAYATGSEFNLKVNADNTGASTLNVSAVAAKNIKKYDGAGSKIDLEAGDLQQDQYYKVIYDGTDFILIGKNPVTTSTTSTVGQSLLPDQITISNGTDADHDIDFTAGNFNFDDGLGQAVATALTKQIDAAWVAGDNAGGLDTGSVAADTFYYCYVIHNPTTGVSDAIFTATYNSPTLPTGYTKKAYRGAILTDGAGNIRKFIRKGNVFTFDAPIINYTPTPTTGVFASYTMTVPRKPNIIGWLEAESSYNGTGVVSLNSKWKVTGSTSGGVIHNGGAVSGFTGRSSDFYAIMDSNGTYEHAWDFTAPNGGFTLLVVGWIDKDL
jgi:hypothetical protein